MAAPSLVTGLRCLAFRLESMINDVHITPEGLDSVRKELDELVTKQRPNIAAKIKAARELGDLSENFEYHAAKNEQGLLERRITMLRDRLERSVIIDESAVDGDTIGVGTKVEIEDEDGERMQVEISSVGGVSPDSPVGRALMGRKVSDEVEIQAPSGAWRARILSVSR